MDCGRLTISIRLLRRHDDMVGYCGGMQEPLHRELGLTDDEASSIERILGRFPTHLELAMYAVMWSEHCSYKSSRMHLRRLPTEGELVLVGPGENAGVVDVGDGWAVALRMESHNHPSAIEPHQGAATGAGGIIRDILSVGARPVALLDALSFGPLSSARNRWLLDGVVGGISSYGNSVGVPTVGGEICLDECYDGNPLVNVMCVGILPVDQLVLASASGEGNLAVLLGSSTGRDGIGGVSVLASAGFAGSSDAGDRRSDRATRDAGGAEDRAREYPAGVPSHVLERASKLPSVQVGDPYEEKRLIEACLELQAARLVEGVQDLGGAGIACATSETAARALMGMDVNLDEIPLRERGMAPFEIMTSESQERMLAIVSPENLDRVLEVCARWEVRASVIARVTSPQRGKDGKLTGRLRVLEGWDGRVLADVPAASLSEGAPVLDRPRHRPPRPDDDLGDPDHPDRLEHCDPGRLEQDLLALVGWPGDPSWIFRQYDHQLFLNTIEGPGGDATVLRLGAPGLSRSAGESRGEEDTASSSAQAPRAIALTTDSNAPWCALDPRNGAAATVAESALNLACAGARAVAAVDCINLGDPEHPEVMWQLSEIVDGISEACTALAVPVVGGNVSLYNSSDGIDIDPTPVIGMLGVIDEVRRPPGVRMARGCSLVLLGDGEPVLGGSRWATRLRGLKGGRLPELHLDAHARLIGLLIDLVATETLLYGVHDVSAGGLGVCLAEMAVNSGVGFEVTGLRTAAELFSESPSRVVVSTDDPDEVLERSRSRKVPARHLGDAGGEEMIFEGLLSARVSEVARAWRNAISGVME